MEPWAARRAPLVGDAHFLLDGLSPVHFIYGVGVANLFFLPFAGKMRIRIRATQQCREMMLEGVISILEGMNPRMLEVRLAGFVDDSGPVKKEHAA